MFRTAALRIASALAAVAFRLSGSNIPRPDSLATSAATPLGHYALAEVDRLAHVVMGKGPTRSAAYRDLADQLAPFDGAPVKPFPAPAPPAAG